MKSLEGKRILVSEPLPDMFEAAERLKELGAEVDFGEMIFVRDKKLSAEQMKQVVKEYDGFIAMSREKIPREVLQEADRLAVIGKYGIGVDHIDMEAATEYGVLVTNCPDNRASVAEQAIGLMLALYKRHRFVQHALNVPNWRSQELICSEIDGKVIGFLGVGGISRQVVSRLSGWNCSFIGYDPYLTEEQMAAVNVKKVEWDELFTAADIVSLHLPLTDQTRGCVGEKEFRMMKKSAIFINTARGKIVDQTALISAIKNHEIAGCGLDAMFNEEPIPLDDPLMEIAGYDNVIITPHLAGWTADCLRRHCFTAVNNVIMALQGEKPDNLLNPAALDKAMAKLNGR